MRFGLYAPAIVASGIMLAACGSSTDQSSSATSSSSAPTATATPAPSTTTAANGTKGGYGDTADNPDKTYACAAEAYADDGTTVIAYVTVAGTASSSTSAVCDSLNSATFHKVSSLTVQTPQSACFITTADGSATTRLYGAPKGSDATTQSLCSALLKAAGVGS